ncbi:hypothetical protein B795N_14900 [Marinilactibacillus psychrotolerans]|uniref:ArdC-like ssDNA-binding domain-containing protein n=1 Tax=Marinilactibacillus psychrotolerans TaxID=191770 RepID=UPI001C7D95AA|nr:ArdC-like ssDNA-binding domain-containing protein [Marinilactibacillus psychrotolerans]GEQ33608.1 hypothetical protein B795N_14900 [Marinilactibacillus psychrotolerans]
MAYNDKKKQIDDLTDQLNKSITEYKKSPQEHVKLLNYLTQFKNYSVRNTMLIAGQYEGAIGVKSYKEFQKEGYQVRKGQKSIKIMAPKIEKLYKTDKGTYLPVRYAKADIKEKVKAGKIPTRSDITGFLLVPVFDITQTNAPEEDYPKLYPNRPQNYEFKGSQEQLEALEDTLKEYAHSKGITVKQGEFNSAAKGAYDPINNNILLSNRLSDTNRVKTLSHELGHAEMHNVSAMTQKDPALNIPEVREYQAEMTAYLIGNQLGLDTEEESTRYISNWVNRNDEFKNAISNLENNKFVKSIEEVKEVSVKMIDQIVERYNQVKQERNVPDFEENNLLKKIAELETLKEEFQKENIEFSTPAEQVEFDSKMIELNVLKEKLLETNPEHPYARQETKFAIEWSEHSKLDELAIEVNSETQEITKGKLYSYQEMNQLLTENNIPTEDGSYYKTSITVVGDDIKDILSEKNLYSFLKEEQKNYPELYDPMTEEEDFKVLSHNKWNPLLSDELEKSSMNLERIDLGDSKSFKNLYDHLSKDPLTKTVAIKEHFRVVPATLEESNDKVHSLKETVATKLNFLNDSTGKNQFSKLKNEKLVAVEVCSIKPKNSYQDHILKLKDSTDNTYKVHITTPKTDKKSLYNNWEKGLTGNQWLEQDMKAKLMQDKPDSNYNVMDLEHPNVDKILQPIENMKQVQQTPSI